MKFKGIVHKYGDNINTDVIIPTRHCNTIDPPSLARHCLEDLDPSFVKKVKPGDILVGGFNFGCGSSREVAPLAIKFSGIACVIAKSFARIFYRNSINIGLPIIECPLFVDEVAEKDDVEVNIDHCKITNLTRNTEYLFSAGVGVVQDIIRKGGLVDYVKDSLT